ncbi:MAG: bifunctional UDP-sugar hydrolase/5'-nucleotidase, partial [bacterium]|nr:bifunctional UDP-sugar hydrolase/5'-nucleotidase [bacterium]
TTDSAATGTAPAAAAGSARPWARAIETFPIYGRTVTFEALRAGMIEETVFIRAEVAKLSFVNQGLTGVVVAVNGHELPLEDRPGAVLDLSGLVRWGPNRIRIAARAPPGSSATVGIEIPRFVRAVFFHTNDVHGALEGLAAQAAEVKRVRAHNPNTYFVIAGDIFSGNPVADLTAGRSVVEALNAMGITALTTGNHEFDHGPAETQFRRSESAFPWLGANIRVVNRTATPVAPFDPYLILATDLGQRVALFGLTETPPSTRRQNVVGLEFLDPVTVARVMAAQLRQQADLVVAVTHLGVEVDREVARAAGDLDLIIGGHSHTVLRVPVVENGVPIVQAGANSLFLGRADLVRDLTVRRSSVVAALMETRALREEDAAVRAIVERWNARLAAELDRRVGHAVVPLVRDNSTTRDVSVGNLIADATRAALDRADVGMTNSGGIRASIPSGPITLRSLYTVMPFANYLLLFEITGEQLREVVRTSYSRRNQVDLQVSGITIRYLVDAERRLLDAEITVAGRPLDPSRRYRVAVNDYMGTGGGGYPFPAFGPPVDASSGTDVLELAAFIEKTLRGVVNYPSSEGRIRVEVRR